MSGGDGGSPRVGGAVANGGPESPPPSWPPPPPPPPTPDVPAPSPRVGAPPAGAKGAPELPRRGTDRSTKRCQERKARFIEVWAAERSLWEQGWGRGQSRGRWAHRWWVGGIRSQGNPVGVKNVRGKRAPQPPHPTLRPLLLSPPPSPALAAGPGWVPSCQVSLPPACGQT